MKKIVVSSSNDAQSNIISKLFLENVSRYPNNNALLINEQFYTYQELWEIVHIIYMKIPQNETFDTIGIYCCDDVYSYASILAINLYGAAYVPLNEKFPVNRNVNYIEQCEIKLVLSSSSNITTESLPDTTAILFTEKIIEENLKKYSFSNYDYAKTNQSFAYILFTSGTTGPPKGVPIEYSSVEQFFNYFLDNYNFNEKDKFLQVFDLTFDVSVFSLFMPLLVGGCVYIVPNNGIKYFKIIEYLQRYDITAVSMVPNILRYVQKYLAEIQLPHLKFTMFVGDALVHELARQWKLVSPNGKTFNMYGPTEGTIVCLSYEFKEEQSAIEQVNSIVPIGKAFQGLDTLIIDDNNLPTNKGELCIAGKQVIKHYLYKQQEDKFFVHQGLRYYKTGDIVSCNEFNNFVFYGRKDSQVKINGYRVELSEIENVISNYCNANCVVIYKNDQLTAHIETTDLDEKLIREHINKSLPEYMIPNRIVSIEKLELNTNGKVDRSKLIDK